MTSGAQEDGQDRDPLEAFTGDRASAARLRASLTQVAEGHSGTGIEAIANDVLAGRRSIRDLADDPDFSQVITEGVDVYRRYLDSLTPAERAELVQAAVNSTGDTR